jgi:hypothetical protein
VTARNATPTIFDPPPLVEMRITIENIEPPVWRQLLVPFAMTLRDLHDVIHEAFGWLDCHSHEFRIGGLSFGEADYLNEMLAEEDRHTLPAEEVHLRDFQHRSPHFSYIYDFGDNWVHRIELIAPRHMEPGRRYPACIGGARSRPPEDVGGTSGYREFLATIADPDDPEHAHARRWAGRGFDPEAFDLEKTDRAVRNALRRVRARRRKAAEAAWAEPQDND